MRTSRLAALSPAAAATGLRTLLLLTLIAAEALVVSYLFDFNPGGLDYLNPVYYVTRLARWSAVTLAVFLILVWPRRTALLQGWSEITGGYDARRALAGNVVLFLVLCAACAAFSANAATTASPPWHLLPLIGILLAATGLSLIAVAAPLDRLALLAWEWRRSLLAAAAAGLAIMLLCEIAIGLWQNMAWATLEASGAILRLYETDVIVDRVERGLRVGDFGVKIWDTCSGSEGLALVTGFVTIYLWVFRAELRFPHALLLYPVGLAASWLLNAVRIAALTSIGAHISPDMAAKGFHSQAGWIAFLLVALGLMALAGRTGLMARPKTAAEPVRPVSARYEATVTHLLPFMALMIGSIAMSATAPHDRPVYVVKAALVGGALWLCRASYASWRFEISGAAVGTGVLVGAAWILTAPATAADAPLAVWLAELGPAAAVAWIVVRGIGTIVLVPIAEELAFRGYLYRRLIGRDFHVIPPTRLSWLALVMSSLVFGALHDRWLAAAAAGVVFGLVMVRHGRIGDAIVAHAAANALIFGWALAARQWSLL